MNDAALDARSVIEDMKEQYDTPTDLLRKLLLDFIDSKGLAVELRDYISAHEDSDYPDDIQTDTLLR